LANTVTHGVGLAFSVAGLAFLVVTASLRGGIRHVLACGVYGATLVILYLASTMYHASRGPRVRKAWRVVDHAAIYLLIAGTYTPFALVSLRGGWGWSVFGVAWGLAVLGVIFKILFTGRYAILSMSLYLAMGWIAVVIIKPLLTRLPPGAVWWLLAGGLCYTVGAVFCGWKKWRHHHAIWHLFVMAGSTCHFFAVMFYVLP
jgi:hemolysin III